MHVFYVGYEIELISYDVIINSIGSSQSIVKHSRVILYLKNSVFLLI